MINIKGIKSESKFRQDAVNAFIKLSNFFKTVEIRLDRGATHILDDVGSLSSSDDTPFELSFDINRNICIMYFKYEGIATDIESRGVRKELLYLPLKFPESIKVENMKNRQEVVRTVALEIIKDRINKYSFDKLSMSDHTKGAQLINLFKDKIYVPDYQIAENTLLYKNIFEGHSIDQSYALYWSEHVLSGMEKREENRLAYHIGKEKLIWLPGKDTSKKVLEIAERGLDGSELESEKRLLLSSLQAFEHQLDLLKGDERHELLLLRDEDFTQQLDAVGIKSLYHYTEYGYQGYKENSPELYKDWKDLAAFELKERLAHRLKFLLFDYFLGI